MPTEFQIPDYEVLIHSADSLVDGAEADDRRPTNWVEMIETDEEPVHDLSGLAPVGELPNRMTHQVIDWIKGQQEANLTILRHLKRLREGQATEEEAAVFKREWGLSADDSEAVEGEMKLFASNLDYLQSYVNAMKQGNTRLVLELWLDRFS